MGITETERAAIRSVVPNVPCPPSAGAASCDGRGVADDVADAVRDLYERHPYPPQAADLDRERLRWNDARRRATYRLLWPSGDLRVDFSILVAGCGTAQAAKYAVRWPNARVTGIDVSSTSIERTSELKHRYNLQNLELAQLPVERTSDLDRRFDLIVCTGVLHHLPDPDAGLRALREVLEPHGVLQLMVYAPYGRAGIYLLQDYCRRLGIGVSSPEIRDLAKSLSLLPAGHPLTPLLRGTSDLRTEAGLADALLHPRDRPYSVPELFDLLRRNAFEFGRWWRQAPYRPECGALARAPHRELMARLPEEERYAAAELFRGTMLRHSAIVRRDHGDGSGGSARAVRFDDAACLHYVPVRLPDTLCVEERLPPGAAGVLINRSHTDTDIYLPITARERRWFTAIDGSRSIADMLDHAESNESVRGFFERLWQHDQVVFDTSAAPLS